MIRFIIVMFKIRLFFMPTIILGEGSSTGYINRDKINLRKQIKLLEAELAFIKVDKRSKRED